MSRTNMSVDRRKHARFSLKGSAYAVLNTGLGRSLGQISDISMGGLAFRISNGKNGPSGSSKLHIIISENYLFVENLPVKIIDVLPIPNSLPGTSTTINRCCLQFGALSPAQCSQVEYLIRMSSSTTM